MQIERLNGTHAEELLDAVLRSRDIHPPWVQPPTTREAMVEYLSVPVETCLRYGIREPGGGLAGVVSVNSIIRGAFQNGFLGFYALAPHAGRGWMRPGLRAVLGVAFAEHALHRLEANIQPDNTRSARLVQALGFRLEGHSLRYLRIGGKWRDHDRYALTVEEWDANGPA